MLPRIFFLTDLNILAQERKFLAALLKKKETYLQSILLFTILSTYFVSILLSMEEEVSG